MEFLIHGKKTLLNYDELFTHFSFINISAFLLHF